MQLWYCILRASIRQTTIKQVEPVFDKNIKTLILDFLCQHYGCQVLQLLCVFCLLLFCFVAINASYLLERLHNMRLTGSPVFLLTHFSQSAATERHFLRRWLRRLLVISAKGADTHIPVVSRTIYYMSSVLMNISTDCVMTLVRRRSKEVAGSVTCAI